jgi:Tat protein secretion system quality control protein TatD with DNase activity
VAAVAEIKKMRVEDVALQVAQNFEAFFEVKLA